MACTQVITPAVDAVAEVWVAWQKIILTSDGVYSAQAKGKRQGDELTLREAIPSYCYRPLQICVHRSIEIGVD